MTEAYVYDAVRTPRGKGKSDGSLHEITPIQLATQMLEAIRDRNNLDTAYVDDVAAEEQAPRSSPANHRRPSRPPRRSFPRW